MNFCVNHKHIKQGYKFWEVNFFYNKCRLFTKNVLNIWKEWIVYVGIGSDQKYVFTKYRISLYAQLQPQDN
jgi:hypothetical protein